MLPTLSPQSKNLSDKLEELWQRRREGVLHVLEQAEKRLDTVSDDSERKQLQLLYAFGLQKTGKTQQAYKAVTTLIKAHGKQDGSRLKARAYYVLGGIKKDKGDFLEGLEHLNKAYEWFAELDDQHGLADVMYEQGVMHRRMGDMASALDTYFEALDKQRELDDSWGSSATLMEIGVAHRLINKERKSIEFLEESQRIRQRIGDRWGEAATLMNMGLAYKALGKLDEALEAQQKSIRIKEETNDTRGLPPAYHGLGEVYAQMGKTEQAMQSFRKAYDLADTAGDKYGVVILGLSLGRMHQKQENYDAAVEELKPLLPIAQEINAQELQYKIHDTLSQLYSTRQQFEKALHHHRKFHQVKEEVLNEKTNLQIQQADAKYEAKTARQEAEIYRLKNVELAKANEAIKAKQQELENAYEEIQSKNQNLSKTLRQLELVHQRMEDSIHYAQRIQNALLPHRSELKQALPESFIFYQPRDIVSGDFYWLSESEDEVVFAAADCTGHGVPGGFMTVLGKTLLNKVVMDHEETRPDSILEQLDEQLLLALGAREERNIADGMDISIFTYHKSKRTVQISGAKNDTYLVRDGEIEVIKASVSPIGGSKLHYRKSKSFTSQEFSLKQGDMLYMASDGFQDQFGGKDKEKFTRRRFRELLSNLGKLPVSEQRHVLERTFKEWKKQEDQLDDILVVGIRF